MPIYEYICENCGGQFDKLRPMKEADAPIPCAKCESIQTRRRLSKFFAHSEGKVLAGSSCGCGGNCKGGCSGCSGGSCGSCQN
jgi:putative FmdB family regulatory protein